jgi:hypothetical protein
MYSFYRKASSIFFANENSLKGKITAMRDREFSAYLSVLSQVHDSLKQGVDFEQAISDAAGAAYVSKIKSIIDDIGMETFSSKSFDEITKSLEDFRAPPEEEVKIPGVEPTTSYTNPSPKLDVNELLGMLPEERYEYFLKLNYPDSEKQKAKHVLENLRLINLFYSDEATPESSKETILRDLIDAMATLQTMADKQISGEISEENEEPLDDEDEGPGSAGKGRDLNKKISPNSKKENSKKKYVSNASSSADISQDDVLEQETFIKNESFKIFQQKSNNPYVDFSVTPPKVNDDLELVFGKFFSDLEKIFQEAWSSLDSSKPVLKQKLNTLLYSIKVADVMTYNELQNALKDYPKEYEREYKNLEHRLSNELPTQVILKDEYFDTLFYAAIFLSAPKLGELLMSEDHKLLENEALKNTHIQESDFDLIKSKMESFAKVNFKSKAVDYFKLNSRYKEKNFLDRCGLRWDTVFKRSLEKVYPSGPKFTLKPCPTCYKWVPWSYTGMAKKKQEEFQGFYVRLISYFTNNIEHPKITLEDLQARKWPALPSSLYSNEREQQLANKYMREGDKSWDEIQDLLNSNDSKKHEEGWHRRSGALYAAGGQFLSSKDTLINSVMTECPFNSAGKSGCGISFTPTKAGGVISGKTALQPQWNGIPDSTRNRSYQTNTLAEELWDDKELFQQAKSLQRGGYKFSRINFACTCRIAQPDSLSSYKHSNIAISKAGLAGSRDFVYPTQPNGTVDDTIEDGTLTYMVCGAPTSLSSFDRNSNSVGFILKYLKETRESSFEDYRGLMSYLIKEGVDIQSIMDLDQDLDRYVQETVEKQADSIQVRMKKISSLLKEAVISLPNEGFGSDKRKYFGGLTLVCPFGHKFTVEHSLRFAEANAGIFQKEGLLKNYASLVTTNGESNLKTLIKEKYIVPADDKEMSGYPNKMPYEKWKLQPNGVVFPDFKNPELPLLTFSIPVNLNGDMVDYVFYKKGHGWKDSIWLPNHSYESSRHEVNSLELDESERAALTSKSGDDEDSFDVMDIAGYQEWNIKENNSVVDFEFNQMPSKPIPGAGKLENDVGIDPQELNNRIESFSRALKSTLRIIITWTKGLVSDQMMSTMLTDYKVDLSPYIEELSAPLIPHLILEDLSGERLSINDKSPEVQSLISDAKKYILNKVNEKSNITYDWIRSNIHELPEDKTFDEQIAVTIIANAIREFNSPDLDTAFFSEYGEATLDMDNLDTVSKIIAKKIVDSNQQITKEILLRSVSHKEYEKRKVQYNSRVFMVGYSQYLANALSLIYKKYCLDKNSYLYIGYDIGINLSDPTKILGYMKEGAWVGGISEDQVDNIISSLSEAIKNSGPFAKVKPQTLHYGYRIDRAWEELESYLTRAKKYSVSARATELSREYIVSRLSFISGQKIADVKEKISGVYPSRSILFNGTTEKPETATYLVTKRRIPHISKEHNFVKLPGTQIVHEWVVRNKITNEIFVYSDEAEANGKLSTILANTQELDKKNWVLEPDPYWVNENYNFDSSKMQVGILTPKVRVDFEWPPQPGTMDFVGINLPFEITDKKVDASVNKAKDVPILGLRMIVDFDGYPLDISPLIRKGDGSDLTIAKINKAEQYIIEANKSTQRAIELYRQEMSNDINKNPKILADFIASEEAKLMIAIEPYLEIINSQNTYLTTKQSYQDPAELGFGRPMMRIAIEDPIRAYKIIMNPQIRGVNLTSEQQDMLIEFIIRIYNLDMIRDYARTIYPDLQTKDLFEKIDVLNFKKINSKMKSGVSYTSEGKEQLGWAHLPGEYFNLIPGEQGTDSGSYLQYVYNTNQNVASTLAQGKHPNMKTLVNASHTVKEHGLSEKEADNNMFVSKMEKDMLSYIRSRTSGERQNAAKDHKKKKASKESNKVTLTEYKLSRILDTAELSLGLPFDDVEIPNF